MILALGSALKQCGVLRRDPDALAHWLLIGDVDVG
jgi:hypothetical protein